MAEVVDISGESIALGRLLKFAGLAESGAHAREIIADGDVRVDGVVEQRRGAQIRDGSVVEVDHPGGTETLQVRATP